MFSKHSQLFNMQSLQKQNVIVVFAFIFAEPNELIRSQAVNIQPQMTVVFCNALNLRCSCRGMRATAVSVILLRRVLSKKYSSGVVSIKEPLLCSAFRQDFEYAKSRHHSKRYTRSGAGSGGWYPRLRCAKKVRSVILCDQVVLTGLVQRKYN